MQNTLPSLVRQGFRSRGGRRIHWSIGEVKRGAAENTFLSAEVRSAARETPSYPRRAARNPKGISDFLNAAARTGRTSLQQTAVRTNVNAP